MGLVWCMTYYYSCDNCKVKIKAVSLDSIKDLSFCKVNLWKCASLVKFHASKQYVGVVPGTS